MQRISFLAVTVLLLAVSCTQKINFAVSSVVPAARGYVKIKKDNNQNYHLHVHVTQLAEVSRLQQEQQTYVVWMAAGANEVRNIGKISSDQSVFGGKLKAIFETVSAIKPTKIFITAEENALTQQPSGVLILTTDDF